MSGYFSDFRPKNFKFSNLPSTCPEEHVVAWIFFEKNWIVLDFLQKPLAWFSKFYPCVQSKNCGRNVWFVLLFRTFSEFERNVFRLLAKKLQEVVETTFYVCRGTVCGLKFFLYFKSFWIFWRNLWHGSQNSIYVSRVKFAEATIFSSVLFRILLNFQRNIFRLLARKLQEVVKTTFRVCRWTSFGLKSFLKILNRFGFSEELGHGSQTLSSCPEYKIRKKQFFYSSFQNFFGFWAKNFSDFWPKNFKKLQKSTLCVSRRTIFGFKKFSKVLNRFGFSSEAFGTVLKLPSSCPE